MHNQDTTKDDILEALFELSKMAAQYLTEHFKQLKLQAEQKRIQDEALQAMQKLNGSDPVDLENDPHKLFKSAMKYIEENTDDVRIKNMAKLFHDNPLDGIKMIDEVQNHKRQDQAIQLSESSKEIIENLKRAQEINSQKVEPDPQTEQLLNNLIQQEESKLESAATILKHDIDLENSPINSITNDDVKAIADVFKGYMNSTEQEIENEEVAIEFSMNKLERDVLREATKARSVDEIKSIVMTDGVYIQDFEPKTDEEKQMVELIKKEISLNDNLKETDNKLEMDFNEDGLMIVTQYTNKSPIQKVHLYEFIEPHMIDNGDDIEMTSYEESYKKVTFEVEKESGLILNSKEFDMVEFKDINRLWMQKHGENKTQNEEKNLDEIIKEAIEKSKDREKENDKQRGIER